MPDNGKIDRARRNALRAAGLIVGSVVASVATHKQAAAQSADSLRGMAPVSAQRPQPPGAGGRCFARGTQVRARDGYRSVEALAVGDEVALWRGGFASVKAVAKHSLSGATGRWEGDLDNVPVVIRRGALGENLPTADLCVTSLHAVYVDGFLMKAGDLVNGTSIFFKPVDARQVIEFFNIELERHEILDVQGASFESLYLAGMERCAPLLAFDGGRGRLRSHMRSVASLVTDRRQPIDIIRDSLEERALGFARAA